MAHIRTLDTQRQAAAISWMSKAFGDQIELSIWNVDHMVEFDEKYSNGEIIGAVIEGTAELLIGKDSQETSTIGPNQSWFLPEGTIYQWKIKSVPFRAVIAMPRGESM